MAQTLADEGWEFAVKGTGVLTTVNGRERRRCYLRRRKPPKPPRTTGHDPT